MQIITILYQFQLYIKGGVFQICIFYSQGTTSFRGANILKITGAGTEMLMQKAGVVGMKCRGVTNSSQCTLKDLWNNLLRRILWF